MAQKRGKKKDKLLSIVRMLQNREEIPPKHRLHQLAGDFKNCHELHIEPDWLLIFKTDEYNIILLRTGTHSDLFR